MHYDCLLCVMSITYLGCRYDLGVKGQCQIFLKSELLLLVLIEGVLESNT